jgi:CRISPR system Cascade subunit CasE
MSALHLVRLRVEPAALMRFAAGQGLLKSQDDTLGYAMHAWLAAMFGESAPQPFRFFVKRQEVFAYSPCDAAALVQQAKTYADPTAWAALELDSLVSKPMRVDWRVGERLQADVLACPVSRKDGREKDVFLRAVDRFGDQVPDRQEVYAEWWARQWGFSVALERLEITSVGRARMMRRTQRLEQGGARKVHEVERPFAEFRTVFNVREPEAFAALLSRGMGRHRAFGFGMVLLSPPP